MGAGFILYKENPYRIFVLYKPQHYSVELDLPKGTSDVSESLLDTALRECYEESGIWVDVDTIERHFHINNRQLTLFVAPFLKEYTPSLKHNPESGELEHIGWGWCLAGSFSKYCLRYLTQVGKHL